jgi:uncharacterized pyridoxal phosphate-containing UPF0001 family protein
MKNIAIVGLMGMATFTTDQNQIKKGISASKNIFEKTQKFKKIIAKNILSMGMLAIIL